MLCRIAIVLAVAALAAATASSAAAATGPTVYVADGNSFSVAFKVEAGRTYVLGLGTQIYCNYLEPADRLGPSGFSAFPAPKLMRGGAGGFAVEESIGGPFGLGGTRVEVAVSGEGLTGEFMVDESVERFHCQTGSYFPADSHVEFEARRFEPATDPEPPGPDEIPVYFASGGPVEAFVRTRNEVVGIRGSFVPRCPVAGGTRRASRRPLFDSPVYVPRAADGRFRRQVRRAGRTRSGAAVAETISIAGRVSDGAVSGTYRRVRSEKPKRGSARKCITGPLSFRAVRYLPARTG